MKLYTADFETTTEEEDCRVWAYGICEIEKPYCNFTYGNNIEDFMKFLSNPKSNDVFYFHNLKFDGEYIFYYLLKHDFECIKDKKDKKDKTFSCLISDTGQFYSIEIYFEVKKNKVNKATIYDSMKIINMSAKKIAEDFHLPILKGEIDYHAKREIGHKLTTEEVSYLRNDVEIMARALDVFFERNLNKMTIGANALAFYKTTINFDNYFPKLEYEIDQDIRQSYKGGWVYLNPIYTEKEVKNGIVIDKNSMYPSHMMYDNLPFGEPQFFEGEYVNDICYPLYIQNISCSFELKKGKLPSIQLKNTLGFLPNEYIETTKKEIVTLCLTNIDLDLFFEHYEVENVYYHNGYKFKKMKGLFCKYIDYWTNEKIKAKKEENAAMYVTSKLFLNSLYGKFGLNPNVRGKYPVLGEDEIIHYSLYEREIRDSIYCPIASFITALCRNDIIRNSQKVRDFSLQKYGFDAFVYSDTDSIHTIGLKEEDIASLMDIDKYKLGAWDMELKFSRACFIRQKCYIEEKEDGTIKTTIAGLPKKLGQYINFNNFKKGFQILASERDKEHKLRYKHVKGGVVLIDTDFTIN